ncbi:MAG: hypothetical protein KDJ75_05740 [Alphaproteobacteria bacterium]|nr:hypothetical protein [Alphaproteobacteria bacterium]
MSTRQTGNHDSAFADEINIMVANALKTALEQSENNLELAVSAISNIAQSNYKTLITSQRVEAFKTARKIDNCAQYDPSTQANQIPQQCVAAAKNLRSLSLIWKNEVHIARTSSDNLPWLNGGIVRVTAELRNGTDDQTAINFIKNAFNTNVIGNIESSGRNRTLSFDTVPFPKQPNSPDLIVQEQSL